MRKTAVAKVLARRLGIPISRVNHIGDRLGDAGLVSKAEGSRRFPPDLSQLEIGAFVLATIAHRGLGRVAETAHEFANLTDAHGIRFGETLLAIVGGTLNIAAVVFGSLVVKLDTPSISLTLGGEHRVYGPETEMAGRHAVVPGRILAAIALELRGHSPAEADTMIALAGAHRAAAAVLAA